MINFRESMSVLKCYNQYTFLFNIPMERQQWPADHVGLELGAGWGESLGAQGFLSFKTLCDY